jgi:asparagine synthase (glutamine-hydrolysing)
MAPPFTLKKGNRLFATIDDILRGGSAGDLPFFDKRAVVKILDGLHARDAVNDGVNDPLLIMAASLAVLQKSYGLARP